MNSSKGNASSKEHGLRTCMHKNNPSFSKGGKHYSSKSTDKSGSPNSLSSLSGKTSLSTIAGDKLPDTPSHSSIGESQQKLISPTARIYHQMGPALKPVWTGNFEIKDSPHDLAFCEGIIAHPAAKVSRKAYSFSKQLPRVLQFMVYAQCQFLPHLFDTNCPSRDDIALFFYPSKHRSHRSKQQYALLLKFMERKGFMLRSRIGAIELLVFPSTLLDADSKKLNGHYFMWGVFRHIKGSRYIC